MQICGSLDVQSFLHKSFVYIKEALDLPADYVSIIYYSADIRRLIIMAVANEDGSVLVNDSVAVPKDKHQYIISDNRSADAVITDSLEDHPVAGLWVAKGYTNDTAQISLRLEIKGAYIGAVNFCSKGKNEFTQAHVEMLSLLKEPFSIAVSNVIVYQELLEAKGALQEDNQLLQNELRMASGGEIVGKDRGMWGVMEKVYQVAPLSNSVLLLGETGTGKELVANTIHNLSDRKDMPFIKVNCGAIPETLIDSELFGHEKGAFTGAFFRKQGRFERAQKGTLFLDEVGELKPDAQIRLLRVLQEKEIERVGGDTPIKVDVRIIAATHRNLLKRVEDGQFREDLYYRLNVFPIVIPPLRDRKLDIPLLVQHFIAKKTLDMGIDKIPPLSVESHEQLLAYSWPGNVRELENAVERALILCKGAPLTFPDLDTSPRSTPRKVDPPNDALHSKASFESALDLDAVMVDHILNVLKITRGKVHGKDGAAAILNVNPSTLRNKMKKLKIPFGRNTLKRN